jgi:Ca2+-binding EF-hand superfamily protein
MALSAEQEISSLFSLFDLNADGEITPKEVEQVLIASAARGRGTPAALSDAGRRRWQ